MLRTSGISIGPVLNLHHTELVAALRAAICSIYNHSSQDFDATAAQISLEEAEQILANLIEKELLFVSGKSLAAELEYLRGGQNK